MRGAAWIVAVAAVVLGVGCSGGQKNAVTAPSTETGLVATEAMADLTLWTGQLCDQALDAQILQMRDREQDRTVSRTQSCPAGGEVTLEGTLNRHRHGNGNAIEGSGTRRVSECDFDRGDGAVVASGFAHWNTHQFRVGSESSGDQKTQWQGETTFRFRDGSARTCDFDVTITRNPGRQQQSMEGEICGQQVRRSDRWSPD